MKQRRRIRGLGSSIEVHEAKLELYLSLGNRFLKDAGNNKSPNQCANAFEALHFASKASAENGHVGMDKVRPSEITQLEKRARAAVSHNCVCSENRIRSKR